MGLSKPINLNINIPDFQDVNEKLSVLESSLTKIDKDTPKLLVIYDMWAKCNTEKKQETGYPTGKLYIAFQKRKIFDESIQLEPIKEIYLPNMEERNVITNGVNIINDLFDNLPENKELSYIKLNMIDAYTDSPNSIPGGFTITNSKDSVTNNASWYNLRGNTNFIPVILTPSTGDNSQTISPQLNYILNEHYPVMTFYHNMSINYEYSSWYKFQLEYYFKEV